MHSELGTYFERLMDEMSAGRRTSSRHERALSAQWACITMWAMHAILALEKPRRYECSRCDNTGQICAPNLTLCVLILVVCLVTKTAPKSCSALPTPRVSMRLAVSGHNVTGRLEESFHQDGA